MVDRIESMLAAVDWAEVACEQGPVADFPERIRKAAVMSLDESLWNRPEILKYFRFRNDSVLRRPIEVLELE